MKCIILQNNYIEKLVLRVINK